MNALEIICEYQIIDLYDNLEIDEQIIPTNYKISINMKHGAKLCFQSLTLEQGAQLTIFGEYQITNIIGDQNRVIISDYEIEI